MKEKKQLWQAIKFTLFSLSAGIIQIGSFALLEIFIQDYWVPYLISLVLSILWNFTLNRRYTFKSAANVPVAMAKVFGFYLVFTPATTILGDYLAEKDKNIKDEKLKVLVGHTPLQVICGALLGFVIAVAYFFILA